MSKKPTKADYRRFLNERHPVPYAQYTVYCADLSKNNRRTAIICTRRTAICLIGNSTRGLPRVVHP